MIYNRTQFQGNSMPLLMGFTEPKKVESDETPIVSYYDPISQVRLIECGRMVGTRSLKVFTTTKRKSNRWDNVSTISQDKKNEIDDQKFVK